VNSVPSIGFIFSSTRTQSMPVTAPFSPSNLRVMHGEIALGAFLVAGRGAQLHRPVRPVQHLVLDLRRHRHDFELGDLQAPWRIEVPMQSEPVSPPPMTTTCLPAARIGSLVPIGSPRRGGSAAAEIHREMHAGEIAAGRGQVAPQLGAARERDRVVAFQQRGGGDVACRPDRLAVEHDAFGLHLLDAAFDVPLFHLEVGNAIAKQAAGLRVLLVDMHVVAGARELLRAGEAGGPRADHGDALAGLSSSAAPA
jgi:hypothetical protein